MLTIRTRALATVDGYVVWTSTSTLGERSGDFALRPVIGKPQARVSCDGAGSL